MNKSYPESVTADKQVLVEAYQYSTYSLKDSMGDNGDWDD